MIDLTLSLTENTRLRIRQFDPFADGHYNYRLTIELKIDLGTWSDGSEGIEINGVIVPLPRNELLLGEEQFLPFLKRLEQVKKLLVLV